MIAGLKRFPFAALLMLLVAASPVWAQGAPADPERQAAAKELMDAMNVQEQFHKTLASMQGMLTQQMKLQPGGEKAMAMIGKIFDADSEDVKTYLTEAEAALQVFYAERFTAAELKEIAAFQRSEAGKKLQAAIPDMVTSLGPPLGKFQESVKKKVVEELSAKPKE